MIAGGLGQDAGRGTDHDAAGSGICPIVPEDYAHLSNAPELAAAWEEAVASRQAEARKLQHLLDYRDRRLAQEEPKHDFRRAAVLKAVHREIALVLGLPEGQVARMLTTVNTAKEWLPRIWEAYRAGAVDADRVQKVTEGAAELIETNTGDRQAQRDLTGALDARFCVPVAGDHRNTISRKVRDTVAALDTAGHQRRYEVAQSTRSVSFAELGNGMTLMKALLPTLVLAGLEEQLHASAATAARKQKNAAGEVAKIGYHQRMADILTGWLLTGSGTAQPGSAGQVPKPAAVRRAGINITIPLETFTGVSDAPAASTDGRFVLPAAQARVILSDPAVEKSFYLTGTWTSPDGNQQPVRIVKLGTTHSLENSGSSASSGGPEAVSRQLAEKLLSGKNILETVSSSRFVTGNLRDAVLLRDGHCQAEGCLEPGFRSELDHTTSYETGGATSAANTQVLCHHHHQVKSHALLPELSTGTDPPPAWAIRTTD